MRAARAAFAMNPRTGGFNQYSNRVSQVSKQRLNFFDTYSRPTAIQSNADLSGGVIPARTGGTAGNNDGTIVDCLNAMKQGNGQSTRIGEEIIAKKAYVTGVVYTAQNSAGTAPTEQELVYIALVLDKQANGAVAASQDMFVNPGFVNSPGSANCVGNPLLKLENSKRFKVLDSKWVMLEPRPIAQTPTVGVYGLSGTSSAFTLNWRGALKCNYTKEDEGVASCLDHAMYVVAFAQSGNAVTNIQYNARLRYVA